MQTFPFSSALPWLTQFTSVYIINQNSFFALSICNCCPQSQKISTDTIFISNNVKKFKIKAHFCILVIKKVHKNFKVHWQKNNWEASWKMNACSCSTYGYAFSNFEIHNTASPLLQKAFNHFCCFTHQRIDYFSLNLWVWKNYVQTHDILIWKSYLESKMLPILLKLDTWLPWTVQYGW